MNGFVNKGDRLEDALELNSPLSQRRVAFIGKLGGLTKREALQMVRDHGGIPIERLGADVDLIVIGADQLPLTDPAELLSEEMRRRVASGATDLILETDLWQQLGLVDLQQNIKQLYTPAMLAELLGVSVRNIRRWHRMGLIVPARVVHRLPYFDFQEVSTARKLASWIAGGASPAKIKKQLTDLAQWLPSGQRSLAQLSIIVEGKQLLLRQGEGLVEPGGQRRIDFDAFEDHNTDENESGKNQVLTVENALLLRDPDYFTNKLSSDIREMVQQAQDMEDEGRLQEAIEWYRVILARFGPQPEIHFQLAELLYREGEVQAARERYYSAIELDEDYVEARANLGCVLLETGRADLAIAAFRGALARHDEYPDVHYHLARTLDDQGERGPAMDHWRRFLELSPSSPWADEARDRISS